VLARRRSFAGDTAWQRRDGARSAASRKLNEARSAAPAQSARHVREALLGLVADLRNKPAAGFTSADALREMSATPLELQNKTRELLEALEAVEYAPQSAVDSAVYIRKADELIPEIHRALEKSR
jgi:vacuolar-type H+-ATPase subunit E/Vma4